MDSLEKKMLIIAAVFIIMTTALLVFAKVYGNSLPLCKSGHENMEWNFSTKTFSRVWICDSR